MPQDTTIYWNGTGRIPAIIDSLAPEYRSDLIRAVLDIKAKNTYTDPTYAYVLLVSIIAVIYFTIRWSNQVTKRRSAEIDYADIEPIQNSINTDQTLIYKGSQLQFSIAALSNILAKRFPFFVSLNPFEKEKFINRLQQFIAQKTFVIHDTSGFKEMPVLISAAAIQLSFGLEKFLLPGFEFIHIFPEEFIGVHPSIRVLQGNVSGNTIYLSWKHFLQGFQYPDDGQNVGLHEMAHAYYYQYVETDFETDKNFVTAFPAFTNYGNKVFQQEALPGFDLYSDYALRNFQEFWAESIEIFFEKPLAMKTQYPDMYTTLCILLNQHPAEKI